MNRSLLWFLAWLLAAVLLAALAAACGGADMPAGTVVATLLSILSLGFALIELAHYYIALSNRRH